MTGPNDPGEASASLAEEAVRLLAALRETRPPAEHSPTCTWCPVCRGVEAVRAVDPAAVDRLSVAITLLAQALSELGSHLRERVAPPGYVPPTTAHAQTGAGGGTGATFDIPVSDEDPP